MKLEKAAQSFLVERSVKASAKQGNLSDSFAKKLESIESKQSGKDVSSVVGKTTEQNKTKEIGNAVSQGGESEQGDAFKDFSLKESEVKESPKESVEDKNIVSAEETVEAEKAIQVVEVDLPEIVLSEEKGEFVEEIEEAPKDDKDETLKLKEEPDKVEILEEEAIPVEEKSSTELGDDEKKVSNKLREDKGKKVEQREEKDEGIDFSKSAVNYLQNSEGDVSDFEVVEKPKEDSASELIVKPEVLTETAEDNSLLGDGNGGEGKKSERSVKDEGNLSSSVRTIAVGEVQNREFDEVIAERFNMEQESVKSMLDDVSYQVNQSKKQITVQLKPKELGEMTLDLRMDKGSIVAKIVVENDKAKAMVEQNLFQLKETLKSSKVEIKTVEVYVGTNENFKNHQGQMQQHKQSLKKNVLRSIRSVKGYGEQLTEEDLSLKIQGQGESLDISV